MAILRIVAYLFVITGFVDIVVSWWPDNHFS